MRKLISVCMMAALVLVVSSAWAAPIPTANMALWLAADDVNGDGTNPTDGAQVTTWVDKSGSGNNLGLRTDPQTGPIYVASGGPNNKPTVNFDGVGAQLGNYYTTLTSPEIFMVMKANGAAGGTIVGMSGGTGFSWAVNATTGTLRGWARENVGDPNYRSLGSPTTPSIASAYNLLTMYTSPTDRGLTEYPQGVPTHLTAIIQNAGDAGGTQYNGADDYAYGTATPGYPLNVSIPYVGGVGNGTHVDELVLGTDGGYSPGNAMNIAEMLIYNNPTGYPMSVSDRNAVSGYLYTKYFATPEPGTLVMLAVGLIGLLAYAWRKRR